MIRIGVDAHNLEGERTGVGRYLENLLLCWSSMPRIQERARFFLYFKGPVPSDTFLRNPLFVCKSLQIIPRPSFFVYFLFAMPLRSWHDKLDVLFFPGYMVPPTYVGKSVLALHDIAFERFPSLFPLRYRIPYKLLGRYGAIASKAICTVSEFSKKEIEEIYGIPSEKIHVTPLGVDSRIKRTSQEDIGRVKEKFDITNEYILYVGQIFNRRHVAEAMEGFANIAPQFPRVQFFIVGQNRTNPHIAIEKRADEINARLGRQAILRVQYVDNDDLAPLYSGASAGLYLSDYEGFGLPPLEFLACGTPVLAPNTTSLADTLQGMQSIVIDPANPREISEKLREVLNDGLLKERIRVEGPEYVKQFAWERCAEQTLRVLEDAAAN